MICFGQQRINGFFLNFMRWIPCDPLVAFMLCRQDLDVFDQFRHVDDQRLTLFGLFTANDVAIFVFKSFVDAQMFQLDAGFFIKFA